MVSTGSKINKAALQLRKHTQPPLVWLFLYDTVHCCREQTLAEQPKPCVDMDGVLFGSKSIDRFYRRFRNNRFWHHFSFIFMTWSFSLLRKNSIDFFLQISSIYLNILKLLQFSLNFLNLLQFTSCTKFLSLIFSFFLTSHSSLTFNFVEKNLTKNGSHPRQPRYHRDVFEIRCASPTSL